LPFERVGSADKVDHLLALPTDVLEALLRHLSAVRDRRPNPGPSLALSFSAHLPSSILLSSSARSAASRRRARCATACTQPAPARGQPSSPTHSSRRTTHHTETAPASRRTVAPSLAATDGLMAASPRVRNRRSNCGLWHTAERRGAADTRVWIELRPSAQQRTCRRCCLTPLFSPQVPSLTRKL
jgi:hypothetical protein